MDCFDSNILVAIVTALVGIFAFIGVLQQLRLSNRHFLFDRRLSAYMSLRSLVGVFQHSVSLLKGSESLPFNGFGAEVIFGTICNTPVWADATGGDVLHVGGEMQTKFLLKCDELRNFAESLTFLFSIKYIDEAAEFVTLYVSIVSTLRGCCICVDSCAETNKELRGFGDCAISVEAELAAFLKHEKYFENVERMEAIMNSDVFDRIFNDMAVELKLGRK